MFNTLFQQKVDPPPPVFTVSSRTVHRVDVEAIVDEVGGVIKKLVERREGEEWVKVMVTKKAGDPHGVKITTESERDAIAKGGEVWVNCLLKATWPYVGEHVGGVVRKGLENTLGGTLRLYNLSLGDAWPEVAGTRVESMDTGSIVVTTTVKWDAAIDLTVDAGVGTGLVGLSAGVDGVSLQGDLTFIIGPPAYTAPYFNAVQFYFTNPPEVTVKLTGLGSIAGSLPGVNDAIHKGVNSALSSICVLPNRISIQLNQNLSEIEAATLRFPPPIGAIHLTATSIRVKQSPGLIWGDVIPPTISLKISGTPIRDDGYALVYSLEQDVEVAIIDHRENVLSSEKMTVEKLVDTNGVVSIGEVELDVKWKTHDEETSPVLVSLQLGKIEIHPGVDPGVGPVRIRVEDGGGMVVSKPGGVRWGKGDMRARHDLMLMVIKRLKDNEVSGDMTAQVLDLPPAMIQELDALDIGELDDWLSRATAHHISQTSVCSPYYGETLHFFHPPSTPLTLTFIDNTDSPLATRTLELPISTTLPGPFNFTPLVRSSGSVACSLTGRILTTSLNDIPVLHVLGDGD